MRDILDPADRWLGTAPLALVPGNKRPVTTDDLLAVLMDSGPVSIAVLANDFDPEGQPLTLLSASAALGTAVAEADGTVTYTPPAGISGFDTVVYTVADDLNQTRTGQVDITISEPQLSIDQQPDNTLVVTAETGLIDITVTDPAEFAGSWQVSVADLGGGPINLMPPTISGTVAEGQTLTANGGLWVYDPGVGPPVQAWQWRRGGADIAGETASTYAVQAGDAGLSALETLTDGNGQRVASSPVVGAVFQPSDDAALLGWWDAADAGTITQSGGLVSSWADKSGGTALSQANTARQPMTGSRLLNGQNVVDFDGTRFAERSEALPASGDVAFHAVLVLDGVSNAFAAVLAFEATNDFQIDANNAAVFDGRLNMTGIGSSANLTGGPFSGALILSAVFDRTGAATAEIFIGNTSRASAGYTAALDSAGALHLMTNRTQNAFVDGAVAELIVTGDVTNRATYHAYLANKWGVS